MSVLYDLDIMACHRTVARANFHWKIYEVAYHRVVVVVVVVVVPFI
jgi:hypothetical protein